MIVLDKTLKIVAATVIAFGFWYLIFWFITSEMNPLHWGGLTKFFYLLLGFMMWSRLEDEFGGGTKSDKTEIISDDEI